MKILLHDRSFQISSQLERNIKSIDSSISVSKLPFINYDPSSLRILEHCRFSDNIESIQKSLTERLESLITTAEKAVSVIERRQTENSLYDREELENILSLKKGNGNF